MTTESEPRCATTPGTCQTCGQPGPEGHNFRHPFNDGSLSVSATFGRRRSDGSNGPPPAAQRRSGGHQPPAPVPPMPFDPVLRQALIAKGVLTPDDLRQAEEQIRAVTAAFEGRTDG